MRRTPPPLFTALPLVALLLSGCGGAVAPDAPALLSAEDLAARAAVASSDPARGTQAAAGLGARAAQLQARAAQIRRASIDAGVQDSLLRRAEALKDR